MAVPLRRGEVMAIPLRKKVLLKNFFFPTAKIPTAIRGGEALIALPLIKQKLFCGFLYTANKGFFQLFLPLLLYLPTKVHFLYFGKSCA